MDPTKADRHPTGLNDLGDRICTQVSVFFRTGLERRVPVVVEEYLADQMSQTLSRPIIEIVQLVTKEVMSRLQPSRTHQQSSGGN